MLSFGLFLTYLILSYLRLFEAFAPYMQPYRPMAVLGIVALLAALGRRASGQVAAAQTHQIVLMLCLLAWVGVSVAVTGWIGGAVGAVNRFSTPVTMFLLTVLNVTSKRRFQIVGGTIIVCTLILAGAAISAYHFGFMRQQLVFEQGVRDESEQVMFDEDSDIAVLRRVRSLGFLNDPNDFAQAMVMVLPMLATVVRRGRFGRNVFLFAIPSGILLYTIYLTHSRGAVLGLLATLCVGARKSIGNIATGFLVAMLLVGVLATNVAGGREFSASEESAGGRIDAWREGIMMLKSNPISGVGYGNFTEHFRFTAHNSFVLCFAELGLVGYFIWFSLLTSVFTSLGPLASHTNTDDDISPFGWRWASALRAAMIGFLTCGWFLSRTYIDTLYLLLGLGAALWFCEMEGQREPTSPPKWVTRAAFAAPVSILLVYLMVYAKNAFS